MGAEGEHLLHPVLQGPRLLPSHDAAVSTSDLKAWCIWGRERNWTSWESTPAHNSFSLDTRYQFCSHSIGKNQPHALPATPWCGAGKCSLAMCSGGKDRFGLFIVSLCHIYDTCYFILQLFFSLSSICCCPFKNDTSNTKACLLC